MEKELVVYKTLKGKEPFIEWLYGLRDKVTRYRIEARIDRMRHGNVEVRLPRMKI